MWSCLPLTVSDRTEAEVKAKRAESSFTAARQCSAIRKIDIDTGALLISEPSMNGEPLDLVTASDSRDPLARNVLWHSTQHSVSLWFSYLIGYLGQILVTYIDGVAEKMDKREYY